MFRHPKLFQSIQANKFGKTGIPRPEQCDKFWQSFPAADEASNLDSVVKDNNTL
jgi:hypothetical protein